jgi:hypothetical protein
MTRDRVTCAREAGFTEEPPPTMILIRAERCRHQPENLAEIGLVRVRYAMRSGGWAYDTVPVEAVVG